MPGSRNQPSTSRSRSTSATELANLAELKSGDLVEIELEIDSKNDYEYIIFEDPKAAGFEPVEIRSGYNGSALGAYMEMRDEKVCFFVRALPRGKHSDQLPDACRDSGPVQRPAHQGLRPCTPRS